jgi:hypothetical protein
MTENREPVVAIIALDTEAQWPEVEQFGGEVKWITVPQETLDQIMEFLEHPETGVRRERPKRRTDASDAG